jgi:hypothetical protein
MWNALIGGSGLAGIICPKDRLLLLIVQRMALLGCMTHTVMLGCSDRLL